MKLLLFTFLFNFTSCDTIPSATVPILQPISAVEFKYVSSAYGWRPHPRTKKQQFHEGIDIATYTEDAQVFATAEGIISKTGHTKSLGLYIIIEHEQETQTLYGHLSKVYVKEEEEVKAGELIGVIGETGAVTGLHLHYEIIHKGKPIDPIKFQENFKKSNQKKSLPN